VVLANHDVLSQEWQASPGFVAGTGGTTNAAALAWLTAYPLAHSGGGPITDDVDHYRVQYSYIGGTVTSTFSPTPDWVIPRDPSDPSSFGVEFTWFEPDESPTTALSITFGEVTAERAIGVREPGPVVGCRRGGHREGRHPATGPVPADGQRLPPHGGRHMGWERQLG
jgi:hypothetical protein